MCGRFVLAYFPDDFSERYVLRHIPEGLTPHLQCRSDAAIARDP